MSDRDSPATADGMNGLRKDIRHGVEVLGRGYQNPPPVASFFSIAAKTVSLPDAVLLGSAREAGRLIDSKRGLSNLFVKRKHPLRLFQIVLRDSGTR